MSSKRISELTELSTPADPDLLVIVDDSEIDYDIKTKKISYSNLKSDITSSFIFENVELKTSDFIANFNRTYLTQGIIIVTLPPPVVGGKMTIKKTDSSLVTLVPYSTEKIEGIAANYLLTSENESAIIVSDGVDWFRI